MKNLIHFSGLNGLRAIAALAVVFAHTTISLSDFGLDPFLFGANAAGTPRTTGLAGYGVSIFFSLSGFLITFLLLEEKRIQPINLKHFYIRRILRIWPLYYLYLTISLLTIWIYGLEFERISSLFYIFLAANVPVILGWVTPLVSHYWSLGVEEQFYAFWPWILKRINSKNILKATVLITTLLILLKCILKFIDTKYAIKLPYELIHVTRFHCMLIGAVAAILYYQKNSIFIKIASGYPAQSVSWFLIVLVTINQFHIASFIDNEIIALVTTLLIIGQIEKKKRIFNLDIVLFDFVGKISYGIYVIHPLIIFFLCKLIKVNTGSTIVNYLLVYASVFLCTIILAYLSYEFYEKRFLKLKEKYTAIKSSANKEKITD